MSRGYQHFVFCILVQLILPLMPVGIEACFKSTVSQSTYSIAAAMYCVSTGVASRNLAMLGAGLVAGMAFSSIFGYVLSSPTNQVNVSVPALITISLFAIAHGAERYFRHVANGELFLDFGDNNE